jgi:hypothetical protein
MMPRNTARMKRPRLYLLHACAWRWKSALIYEIGVHFVVPSGGVSISGIYFLEISVKIFYKIRNIYYRTSEK